MAKNDPSRPATPKQIRFLADSGHNPDDLRGLTISQAGELIEQAIAQNEATVVDAKRRAESIDLIETVRQRTPLPNKEAPGEWSGPCPKCGGDDRLHVKSDWFFCRVCYAPNNGKPHDLIGYLCWIDNKEFVTVCRELTGNAMTTTALKLSTPPAQPKPAKTGPDAKWVHRATKIAQDANHALFNDPNAEPGREYLLGRGIEPHCWEKFNLGFRYDVPLPGTWHSERREYTQPRQPAIVMPWYRAGKVTGIRYRFLKLHEYIGANGRTTSAKQTAQPGSSFEGGLYGGHTLPSYTHLPVENSTGMRVERFRTLVICEGELNAISIWQMTEHWGWDVLSLGSESQKLPQSAIDNARNFGRVLVWMDKATVARDVMALLMPLAFGVNSPVVDDKALDANDMLQRGMLGGFLATMRLRACGKDEELNLVKYALAEADDHPPYLDAGARQVLAGL